MYAPDKEQLHAINHTAGSPHETNRNVLQESARIARGKVEALDGLDQSNFDALIVPGGFGAAMVAPVAVGVRYTHPRLRRGARKPE